MHELYNNDRLDLFEAKLLLKEALAFINQVPNNKYEAFPYKSSYNLASAIDNFLKKPDDDNRETN